MIFDKNINHVLKKLEEIELLYKRRSDEFSKFLQPDYNYLTLNEFKNYQKTLKFNFINDLQLSKSNDYHSKKIILPISNSVNTSALEHLSEFINNQELLSWQTECSYWQITVSEQLPPYHCV